MFSTKTLLAYIATCFVLVAVPGPTVMVVVSSSLERGTRAGGNEIIRRDGAPFDPWLRTHWKLGARPVTIAPRSMVFPGSIKDWQSWTGLRFLESGLYHFLGGLAPLAVNLDTQSAVYVEPNLWMQHALG